MSFIKDIRFLFFFFIVADTITTIYALTTGYFYEGNPFLASIFHNYGYQALIPLKFCYLLPLYFVYLNSERFYWNITRHSVSCIGIAAFLSNSVVIFHG